MKFLIVDDSQAMRKIIIRTLKQAGYEGHEFLEAEDGLDGLKMIESKHPNLVLSDWHMPEMDGIEMLNEIKNRDLNVKVGMVTTERSPENLALAEEAGALFVISKPFNAEQLQEVVIPALDPNGSNRMIKSATLEKHQFILPEIGKIADTMNSLLCVPVNDREIGPSVFSEFPLIVGLYGGEDNRTQAMVICDLFANGVLGASLSRIQPAVMFEMYRQKKIPRGVFDNVSEVLNVFSALFYHEKVQSDIHLIASHLILHKNDKLEALIYGDGVKRLDVEISSDNYGKGKLAIVVVK